LEATLRFALVVLSVLLLLPSRGFACEDGHWIDEVLNDGSVIKLEDGSIWSVDDLDRIDTALWLPVSNIVACDYMLINTDDGEKAGARRVR
jgi:hypothetical protein